MGLKKNPTIIVFLKAHSNKMTPDVIPLHSEIRVLLNTGEMTRSRQ